MQISSRHKVDVALVSQALNNTNATGRFYHAGLWRRFMAVMVGGAMAATKTTKVEFVQATDASGTGAKAVTGAEASVTANTAVTAATLTCASVVAGNAVTINGLTFTGGAADDLPNRVFAVGADNNACAANLAAAINHATAGVPGVTASANAAVVTLTATEPGETTITITDAAGTITPATTQAVAYVELDVSRLDMSNGFEYVAAKVTTTANTTAGVVLVRGEGRYSPEQAVGASAVV